MKRLLCLSLFSVALFVYILAGNIVGGFDLSYFPEVRFIWSDYNPLIQNESNFILTEGEQDVPFSLQLQEAGEYPQGNNAYIILWEDMAAYGNNFYLFSKSLLSDFFKSNIFRPDDQFLLATYDRTYFDETTLKLLTSKFSKDKESLANAVMQHPHNSRTFVDKPQLSDAFPALNEALDILGSIKEVNAKAIILITVGHALENSATNSAVTVQRKAIEKHIPIYVIQYGALSGQSQKFEDLALSTYGMYATVYSASLKQNIFNATNFLDTMYLKSERRYYGHKYEFSYTSQLPRGGETSVLTITDNKEKTQVQFISPNHTLRTWIKAHKVLFCIFVLLFIALIALSVILFVIHRNQQNQQIERLREEQQRMARANQMQGGFSGGAGNRYVDIQRKAEKQRQLKELKELMFTKNMLPKLYGTIDGKIASYDIQQPEVTIGRTADNDIMIDTETISRHHAVIAFTGTGFVIKDTKSTNGTYVNGKRIHGVEALNDQDTVKLGKIGLTFKL